MNTLRGSKNKDLEPGNGRVHAFIHLGDEQMNKLSRREQADEHGVNTCRRCGELMAWPGPVGVVYADGSAEHHQCRSWAAAERALAGVVGTSDEGELIVGGGGCASDRLAEFLPHIRRSVDAALAEGKRVTGGSVPLPEGHGLRGWDLARFGDAVRAYCAELCRADPPRAYAYESAPTFLGGPIGSFGNRREGPRVVRAEPDGSSQHVWFSNAPDIESEIERYDRQLHQEMAQVHQEMAQHVAAERRSKP